ncbi:unnamed protein product [Rotaria sp. Silwood1]|nr:unnamed protein product [Rotaria sp. Silwood1]CAF3345931.1 unnamed protein product [Rotaria sp. Silwood1]CAF5073954.1 unnamed protein product [Rotaria sp. Silwood1]
MSMKFSWFVLVIILVACRTATLYSLYNDDDDDDSREENIEKKSLTSEQLAKLDEYFSLKYNEEPLSEALTRMIHYPNENHITKRDALWTTTEVLECIRRLRYSKNISKLDLVTEMLNCYRRLKHRDTEELVGIQQKPQKAIDWFPIISIILAAIICLIAFIILCKRQIDHRHYIHHQIKRRENNKNKNKNNNQISLSTFDAAECIDGDVEFVAGLNIDLAKGNLILTDYDAQMVS